MNTGIRTPKISPGGKLVCVNHGAKPYGILSIDPYHGISGVSLILLRTYPQMFESAVFSPDGQKIAFLSVDIDSLSGWSWKAIDVKTMNSDGSGLTQVTDDVKAYDLDVSWSR